jgi:hypothetical protein
MVGYIHVALEFDFELSFRRGNGASVARIVPYAALHYMAYEEYRRWIILGFPNIEQGPVLDLVAGSIAGGTAVICTYPLDLVRTKLAYQVGSNPSCILTELENHGSSVGFKSPLMYYGSAYFLNKVHKHHLTNIAVCLIGSI